MLTRISDEKIANLCVKYLGWDEPVSEKDMCFVRELFNAQLKADKEKAQEIFEEIEKSGLAPLNHNLEYYMNEVGQRESKHLPNCELCQWQALKERMLK